MTTTLPTGYTRCEYLESTGIQWIDTAYTTTNNFGIDIEFSVSSYNQFGIFGNEWAVNALLLENLGQTFRWHGSDILIFRDVELHKKYKMYANKNTLVVNGEETTTDSVVPLVNGRFTLFYCKPVEGGGTRIPALMKLYQCAIYDDTSIVMGLIPALDPSNRPCMFDIVSQTPFYNQGSGEFLYGAYRGKLGNDVLSLTNKTIDILSNRKEQLKTVSKEQNQIFSESQNLINSFDNTKITYVDDNTESYSKTVPSNSLKYAEIKSLYGKSVVVNNEIKNAAVSTITSTYPYKLTIPPAIRNLSGYGLSARNAYNAIDFVNKIYTQSVSSVDMGTLTYYAGSDHITSSSAITSTTFYSLDLTSNTKKQIPGGVLANILCSKYSTETAIDCWFALKQGVGVNEWANLYVCDPNYSDASVLKSSLSGVMLNYELATPVITDLSTILEDNYIKVAPQGTITFETSTQIQVPSEITYITKS